MLAALCAAALLAQSASAAVIAVTTTADAGAGSLRTAAGGAVSGDVIQWGAGSGGTITLLSDLPSLTGGVTLDVTPAPAASTIAGAPNAMALGGAVTLFNDNGAQPFTISAPIKGAGSLTKSGAGELDLLGANAFTGGLFLTTGTLSINGDAALGAGSGTFQIYTATVDFLGVVTSTRTWGLNGAAYLNDNGHNSTLTGVVSGGGSLEKTGAGLMELSGTNVYTGGTALDGGTLRIDNASAIGSGALTFNGGAFQVNAASVTLLNPVLINAGGGAFDTMGNFTTLSGVISGAGALAMTSTGTLSLTGANAYAGGTSVTGGGVLLINGDGALGAAGTAVTLSGGSALQFGAGVATSRPLVLGAGGGVVDTNSQSVFLTGLVSGAASLTKAGLGDLTLSNAGGNTYSGGTIVNAGRLLLGSNNAAGTGALTVNAGGTFDLATFTQAAASYAGAGTLRITMPDATHRLTLGGNANFTGSTLVAGLAPQVVANGAVFKPVNAGSFTGLPTVVSPGLVKFTPSVVGNELWLTAALVPMASVAANANQAGIGAAYEPLRAAGTADANAIIGALNTLDVNGVQAALDQMGPVSLGALGGIGMAQSAAQAAAVSQRMLALARSGGADESTIAHYRTVGRAPFPGELYAEPPGDDLAESSRRSGSPWGFFTSGIVTSGKLQEASSGAGLQPGYAFNTGGLTAGADYRVNDHLAAGAAAGWLRGHAGLYFPGSGTMDDQSARLGVYATTFGENFAANLYVGGAVDTYKTARGINFPGVSRVAEGRPHGAELNVHPSASYDVRTRDYGTFSPFAGLDYDRMTIDAFSETGADTLDLNVAAQTAVSADSNLGLKYSQRLVDEGHAFTPYGSLGWRHAFNDQSRPISAAFSSGAPFTVMTGKIARDGTLVGLGVAVDWTRDLTAKLDYQGDFRSHYQDSTAALSLRLRF